MLDAAILMKGQAAYLTMPKHVLKVIGKKLLYILPCYLFRSGFTDLHFEKVITTGFSKPEQKGSCFDITQRELHECIRKNYR